MDEDSSDVPPSQHFALSNCRPQRVLGTDGPLIVVSGRKVAPSGTPPVVNGYRFKECTFEAMELEGLHLDSCIFERCAFNRVDMVDTLFDDCLLKDCHFKGGTWVHAGFRDTRIVDCTFSDISAEMITFISGGVFNTVWSACSIMTSHFYDARIEETSFPEGVVDAVLRECEINKGAFDHLVMPGSSVVIVPPRDAQETEGAKVTSEHDPLARFRVEKKATEKQLEELDELLRTQTDELVFQSFLEANPELLVAPQSLGHHGMYVLSQVCFGGKYRADFMIGAKNSMGHFWTGLEIESPRHSIVKADGHFSAVTQHAIDQVRDWRTYVRKNRATVQRSKAMRGEGLIGIEPDFEVWVIIGRDNTERDSAGERRASYLDRRIHVQTWDGFRGRIEAAIRRSRG